MESSGVLKRGGGIRRKIRESLGSIGGKYLVILEVNMRGGGGGGL